MDLLAFTLILKNITLKISFIFDHLAFLMPLTFGTQGEGLTCRTTILALLEPISKHKMGDEQEGKTDPRFDVYAKAEGLLKLSKQRPLSPVVLISFFILHIAGFHLMLPKPKFVLPTSLPK